jgi:hypothetical protein
MICIAHLIIILGEQVQEYEMGVIFGMYGDKRNAYRILFAKPQERPTLGDSGVNGRIILKWI